MSRQRCQDALTRHLSEVTACLKPLVATVGVRTAGEVTVTASVDTRGRLKEMEATGLKGATECVTEAFTPARLPKADMGLLRVRFVLRYRTVVP